MCIDWRHLGSEPVGVQVCLGEIEVDCSKIIVILYYIYEVQHVLI